MKNRGFTLIELLGVIVILALLVILVFPSIINSIKKASDELDDLTLELIYNATDIYISKNASNYPKLSDNKYIINLQDLVNEDLLPITDLDEDIVNNKCVEVTYNNKFNYEIKDIGTCEGTKIICRPVITATIGNVPLGDYTPGDEYVCQVNNTESYNFVVVNSNETTVSLVTTQPLGQIEYITNEKFLELGGELEDCSYDSNGCVTRDFGPVSALSLVEDWTNLENISLPSLSDVIPNGCEIPKYEGGDCPLWALNLGSVWLSISDPPSDYTVSYTQPYTEQNTWIGYGDKYVGEKYNFSPKITISKYSIKR